jgi:hypothetical protein
MVCHHKIIDGDTVGPTGRRFFFIRVYRCWHCGILIPMYPDELSYQECKWIERYNNHREKIDGRTILNNWDSNWDN